MAAIIPNFSFDEKITRGYENRYNEWKIGSYTLVFINVSQRQDADWDTYNPETRQILKSQCVAFAE